MQDDGLWELELEDEAEVEAEVLGRGGERKLPGQQ